MFFNNYISTIDNPELVLSIKETSKSFSSKISEHFTINQQLNALLLGNVQSGKTAQMLGIISAMADSGYKIFVLLTTDNVDNHIIESKIVFKHLMYLMKERNHY